MHMVPLKEALMDYAVVRKVPSSHSKALKKAIRTTKPLWKGLHLHKPRVVFVELEDDAVAKYVSGTMDYPVFVLCLKNIERVAKESGMDKRELEIGYKGNIAHELIHAYLESVGVDPLDHDEERIEQFTREWLDGIVGAEDVRTMCDEIADELMGAE